LSPVTVEDIEFIKSSI